MVMNSINGLLIKYESYVSYHYLAHSNYRISGYMLHMPTDIFTIANCFLDFYKYSLTLREDIHYRCPLFN